MLLFGGSGGDIDFLRDLFDALAAFFERIIAAFVGNKEEDA